MNSTVLNFLRIFLAINLIIIGIDKFYTFLPPCSLMKNVSATGAMIGGLIEILLGILVLFKIQLKPVLYTSAFLMGAAVVSHLVNGTYDLGGALFLMFYSLGLVYFSNQEIK